MLIYPPLHPLNPKPDGLPPQRRLLAHMPTAIRRRWFQFGLLELLVLTSLLGIIWWKAAVVPETIRIAGTDANGKVFSHTYEYEPAVRIVIERGTGCSILVLVLWLAGRAVNGRCR